MPLNKQALMRYRIIDRRLRSTARPYPNWEELRDACEESLFGSSGDRLSKSTIEKDLRAMREESELAYFAPIAYCRLNRGYHYTEDNFSIEQLQLNDEELEAIQFAAQTLIQFRDVPVFSLFQGAIQKIEDRLSAAPDLKAAAGAVTHIQFEQQTTYHGGAFLATLLASARAAEEVKIDYTKFARTTAAPQSYRLHPHLLKEYRNRWYVVGWDPDAEKERTLGLDRISKITTTDLSFVPRKELDPATLFEHSLGITIGSDAPLEIEARVSWRSARYLASQPIHASQVLAPLSGNHNSEAEYYQLKLHVCPSYELTNYFLGLGEEIEIISPPALRKMLREKLLAAANQYR
jgi:predicted DNA-binding transcriptional regulator YafY